MGARFGFALALLCLSFSLNAADYDYKEVVEKSLLFFEAQRTGVLPSTNRIPWRGDSFLNDSGINGEDLSGGYFDAGDFMKFGFPFASSMHFLAWGIVDFREGYVQSGQLDHALAAVKWGTDWILKAHTGENEVYAQVGLSSVDHSWWGRPEECPPERPRPSFKLDAQNPGSDCAGEYATALAAASMAFRAEDETAYADLLLSEAIEIYKFANASRGRYSDVVIDAGENYRSEEYGDELGLAAAWLFRATGDALYKTEFQRHWFEFDLATRPIETYWEEKRAQLQVLMAKVDGGLQYVAAATNWCNWVMNTAPRTPGGLVWLGNGWGSLAHSANAAFTCLILGQTGINTQNYTELAKSQIDYMLGDGIGRSFLIGFGVDPPERPHHAPSSCPDRPAPCGWDDYDAEGPNPQVLTGALVGGPNQRDEWADDRSDYVGNEVTLDYNSGFQSVAVALVQLLPNSTKH